MSLYDAVLQGDIIEIRRLLKTNVNINELYNSRTLLEIAINNYKCDVAEVLIEANISLKCTMGNGSTLLHLAADRCASNVIVLLIKAGVNIDEVNDDGQTALHLAVKKADVMIYFGTNMVKLLLRYNPDNTIIDKHGKLARDYAVHNQDLINLMANYSPLDIKEPDV